MKRLRPGRCHPSSSRHDFGDEFPWRRCALIVLEQCILAAGDAVLALAPFMEEGAKVMLAQPTVLLARS